MISTRLTARLGLELPLMLAPMALAGGGDLAAACAEAGAFGLVGGGYGDLEWTRREWNVAELRLANTAAAQHLGCGFITWKLDQDASALRIRYWRQGKLLMAEASRIDGSDVTRWNYRPVVPPRDGE